jgi:NADH dehydrogenase
MFQEVWLGPHLGFDAINCKARIYGDGQKKTSWISFRDVAKFAVASLKNSYAENKAIPLGGPEALSPLEVTKIFEEVKGKKMELEFVPLEALKAQYEAAQDPTQKTFTGLMIGYAEGTEIPMNEVLKNMPLKLQSVREYLKGL